MKKMSKKLALLMTAMMFVQLLTGCGTQNKEDTKSQTGDSTTKQQATQTPEKTTSNDTVNLKWALWSADSQPYWKPIAEAYSKQNPNVNIELIDLGASDYDTALTTQMAGSDIPFDVVAVKSMSGYISMIGKGLLKPLDESKIQKDIYGDNLETLKWKDTYYTLPLRSDFYVMFYNKTIFDKAGVAYPSNDMTFEDYDEMVAKLTDTTFGNEIYGAHYHIWANCVQGMALVGERESLLDGNYEYMKPYYEMVLKQQNNKECMDYATIKTSGLHYLGAFGQGNVATMLMGTWSIGTLINRINEGQYPDLTDWSFAAYPHKAGEEAGGSTGSFVGISVVKNSAYEEIAEDFARFAGGPEGAKIVAELGYTPGVMSDEVLNLFFAIEGFPLDETSKEAILGIKNIYQESPMDENNPEITQILNTGHDYIMTGTMTIDEGIEYMNQEVRKIKSK